MKFYKQSVFLITLVLICFFAQCLTKGVFLTIKNNAHNNVYEIMVHYTGGHYQIPILTPDASTKRRINPTSESNISIEFKDHNGNKHSSLVDVYIESEHSGSLDVELNENGSITWKDDLKI